MKPNRIHFDQNDFMKANRRAARLEEIELHGKPVSFRSVKHASMKQYNRQQERRLAFADIDY